MWPEFSIWVSRRRFVPLLALSALFWSNACSTNESHRVMSVNSMKLKVVSYREQIDSGLGLHRPPSWDDPLPTPCTDRFKSVPGGGSDPYQYGTEESFERVPLLEMNSAMNAARSVLERRGWKVVDASISTQGAISRLRLRSPDNFTLLVEGLHGDQRLVVGIGSPCLKRPAGDTGN